MSARALAMRNSFIASRTVRISKGRVLGGELRSVCPENVRQKIALSGVAWKQNVTRHSFVTYHYAAFGDAKKTAREAGHTEEILFTNYRALATEEQGKAYFAVFPK
jgi:hypothetical protein